MGVRSLKLIVAITLSVALGVFVARQLKVSIHATNKPRLKFNPSGESVLQDRIIAEKPVKQNPEQKDGIKPDAIPKPEDTRQDSKAKESEAGTGTEQGSDSSKQTSSKTDVNSPETIEKPDNTETKDASNNQQGQDQEHKADEVKKDKDAQSRDVKGTADGEKKVDLVKEEKQNENPEQNVKHQESGAQKILEEEKQQESKEEHPQKDREADKSIQFQPDASKKEQEDKNVQKDMPVKQENQAINIEQVPRKTTSKPLIETQPKVNENNPAANIEQVPAKTTQKPIQTKPNVNENNPVVNIEQVPSKTTQKPPTPAQPKVNDTIPVVHNLTITNRSPDLGNQLFALAALLGVGYRNKMNIVLPQGTEKLKENLELKETRNYPTKQTKTGDEFGGFDFLYKRKDREYDDRTEHLTDMGKNIEMDGYFHSWKYFRGIENKIRREFTFKAAIRSKVQKYITDTIAGENVTLVGIHVQRGEFLLESAQKFGDTVASQEYIRRAIAFFENHFRNVWFFVAGDGDEWSKDNVKASRLTHSAGLSQMEDLALMAACDHVIATTGTFSWWAGWLAHGITIYYEGYPNPNSPLWSGFRKEDFFPPHWILMK